MISELVPRILRDSYGRAIRDLRISITDRCNFRCFYCMPQEAMEWSPKAEILSYEEIIRLAEIFVALGVNKLRITGGEPMVRRDLESLIERLAAIPGIADLAMTTNAHFLRGRAAGLKWAGLQRITISLDSLQSERFALLTGHNGLRQVLDARREFTFASSNSCRLITARSGGAKWSCRAKNCGSESMQSFRSNACLRPVRARLREDGVLPMARRAKSVSSIR